MVSTMNAIIRWLACLPIVVLGKLITIVCAPVAAYLSMRGDALPRPLRWMQTHDNPIDALWQQPAHMRGYETLIGVQPIWCAAAPLLRWYCRMLWLIRNPAYGLMDRLGYDAAGQPVRVVAVYGVWGSGKTNWCIQAWPGAWQVKAQIFYTRSRYLRIYCGWKQPPGAARMMYCCHINPFRKWGAA